MCLRRVCFWWFTASFAFVDLIVVCLLFVVWLGIFAICGGLG